MAIVHAVSELTHAKTISHTHDGITESHVVPTSEDKEPPHCTKTKIDTNIIQQVRDNADIPDIGKTVISLCLEWDRKTDSITQDTYFQYYPWSENHFFWHLLVGETILVL